MYFVLVFFVLKVGFVFLISGSLLDFSNDCLGLLLKLLSQVSGLSSLDLVELLEFISGDNAGPFDLVLERPSEL